MNAWCVAVDDVLRQAPWVTRQRDSRLAFVRLASQLVVFGLFYGAVMGSFRALTDESQWLLQMAFTSVKVPLLLITTFLISLPSFYVLNSLLGMGRDFAQAARSLVAAQCGLAIVLASMAPLTLLWYASSANHQQALVFNGAMFAVASFAAHRLVRGYYRPLISASRRHAWLLWCWLVVYSGVAIQMAWLLRPFIGAPGRPVQFLRDDPWDNAYEVVGRLVWRTLFP